MAETLNPNPTCTVAYRWSAVDAASASLDDVFKDQLTAVAQLEHFEV